MESTLRGSLNPSWSFMSAPSDKDVRGKRRGHKAFDPPLQPFEYLVVMDFEWTCDNKKKVDPLEIIEFPSVLVQCSFPPKIISQFQVYCQPTVNPKLSKFCTELTGITQDMVDSGVSICEALQQHIAWLQGHGLLSKEDTPRSCGDLAGTANFCIVTWGDSDVMTALESELLRLKIERPAYFDRWINLKALFKSHYKREPRGGLQACVEGCGLKFEGRAHSGLVDSINTAAIVVQMIKQGFRFTRSTRGFGPHGEAWGKKRQASSCADTAATSECGQKQARHEISDGRADLQQEDKVDLQQEDKVELKQEDSSDLQKEDIVDLT